MEIIKQVQQNDIIDMNNIANKKCNYNRIQAKTLIKVKYLQR